jgi:hypothetical protein
MERKLILSKSAVLSNKRMQHHIKKMLFIYGIRLKEENKNYLIKGEEVN